MTERAQLQNELRRTIAQIALGLLVLGTLVVGWRRVRAADRTVEIASEQQITERFTRAVEQLGNEKSMAIRLGGIYALERIAKDSPKDHWQVMEVLTAYVRENARWEGETREWGIPVFEDWDTYSVSTDIQAIVTVLGRRERSSENDGQQIDLSSTDLRGVDLSQGNFANADFEIACLGVANLNGANLYKANLNGANLKGTRMYGASLQEANLSYVELVGAELASANLEGALLMHADLQRSGLLGANLRHAICQSANLREVAISRANVQGASFLRADLTRTNLSEVRGLTQVQIDSAIIDENTTLPDYLKRG